MGYVYNYESKRCYSNPIRGGFRPFGVLNETDIYKGQRRLGLASGDKLGLSVDHFYYTESSDDRSSENTCLTHDSFTHNLTY